MRNLLLTTAAIAAGAFCLAAAATPASAAGTVILEGSDAIGFHSASNSFAATYRDQTFSAIGGASPKSIAVIGQTSFGGPVTSGTHSIVDFANLGAAGTLSDYVAIYFTGANGCCTSAPFNVSGRQADLTSYVAGGGTVEIGNYDGAAGWDFLVGGSGNSAFVAGIGGALSGPGCTDGETVTASGTMNGFTQPGPLGCWTHQAYGQTHFAALGFTKSYFDSDPQFALDNPGYGGFSSLLSNGNTITGGGNGVPEPSAWALMLIGFGGMGAMLRSVRKRHALAA